MQRVHVCTLISILFTSLLLNAPTLHAQSPTSDGDAFTLFLPLVTGNEDLTLADEAFEEPETTIDQTVFPAAATTLTLLPAGYTTLKGADGGQPATNLHSQDQSGTQNDWDKYLELLTPGSQKYIGYRSYSLPASINPTSITTMQLTANYLGPEKTYQSWTWTIYNWSTRKWIKVGDNQGAPAWYWHPFTFNIGGTLSNYVNSSTREIRVRLQSNNNKDDMDLDYEALLLTYNGQPPAPLSQKVAVPTYFYPGESYWTQLESGAPTVGLAIINPADGVGAKKDPNYVTQTNSTKAKGIAVLGYVYTSYGARSLSKVKAEIDKYYQWYGVSGIFLDEVYYDDCAKVSYYKNLFNYVKAKSSQAQVVINPGINFPECMVAASDIAINFEDSYAAYQNWQPSGWESGYPATRFWHLVIATSQSQMPNAIALSKQRNAGWIYVTPDVLNNPWDTLPSATYWQDELNRAQN